MEKRVQHYVERIDILKERIEKDSEKILPIIDLDRLLEDPESYLLLLASEFLTQHEKEIQAGAKEGRSFAKKVLNA